MPAQPTLRGGHNVAMKVPPHQFQTPRAFYRDVLGLEHLKTQGQSEGFRFGSCCLWVEPAARLGGAEDPGW